LAIRVNPEKAQGKHVIINWIFEDTGVRFALNLENCALTYQKDRQRAHADASIFLKRGSLSQVLMKQTSFAEASAQGEIRIEGDSAKLMELMSVLDESRVMFAIVEP
jgi:alkyl sulfatase BDS1-like metallo-beta-lactamase superfamily hydrolase